MLCLHSRVYETHREPHVWYVYVVTHIHTHRSRTMSCYIVRCFGMWCTMHNLCEYDAGFWCWCTVCEHTGGRPLQKSVKFAFSLLAAVVYQKFCCSQLNMEILSIYCSFFVIPFVICVSLSSFLLLLLRHVGDESIYVRLCVCVIVCSPWSRSCGLAVELLAVKEIQFNRTCS